MNIRTLCLGILFFDDVTGYEIKKLAAEGRFNHFIEASYGSIYPTLNRLTDEGLLVWREETQDGKPSRKVYSITDRGRDALFATLHEETRPDIFKSEFLFVCLYSAYLETDTLKKLVSTQVHRLREGLERLQSAAQQCSHPGSQFAIGYGVALHKAAIDYVNENKHLLENSPEIWPDVAAQ